MKYCPKCGEKLLDEDTYCIRCGAELDQEVDADVDGYEEDKEERSHVSSSESSNQNAMATLTKVFMVVGTVILGFAIFPLIWCIPLTIITFNRINNDDEIGVAVNVLNILFVSMLGGIFGIVYDSMRNK